MLIFMLNAYRFISSLYPKLININAVNQIISFFQSFWYSKQGYSITANTETNSNKKKPSQDLQQETHTIFLTCLLFR